MPYHLSDATLTKSISGSTIYLRQIYQPKCSLQTNYLAGPLLLVLAWAGSALKTERLALRG